MPMVGRGQEMMKYFYRTPMKTNIRRVVQPIYIWVYCPLLTISLLKNPWQKMCPFVPRFETSRGTISNAARDVCKLNVRRLELPHAKFTIPARWISSQTVLHSATRPAAMVLSCPNAWKCAFVTYWLSDGVRFKRIFRVWGRKVPHHSKNAARKRLPWKNLYKNRLTGLLFEKAMISEQEGKIGLILLLKSCVCYVFLCSYALPEMADSKW